MQLVVFTPSDSVLDAPVSYLAAQGLVGGFGMRPRHVDFVAPLVSGILNFIDSDDAERFIAVDGGVLMKTGRTVRVATRRAVLGDDLSSLHETVSEEFLALTEHEKEARHAVARLEAGIVRRFIQSEELK